MMAKATTQGGPRRAGPITATVCIACFGAITALAILRTSALSLSPSRAIGHGTILPNGWTIQHFRDALGHGLTLPSIRNSLEHASLATVIDLVLGISIAYVIVRTKLPGREVLDAIAMLPLAVPGIVLAFGYLAMTQEGKFQRTEPPRGSAPDPCHRLQRPATSLCGPFGGSGFSADQCHP